MTHEPSELPAHVQQLLSLDETDGPATPLSDAQSEALIAGALEAWGEPTPAVRQPRRKLRMLLVAAVLLAAGSAAAWFAAERTLWAEEESAPAGAPGANAAGAKAAPAQTPAAQPAPERPPVAEDDPRSRTAQDLLARANHLRAAARYREAADTYLEAAAQAPTAQLAQVAQVAAADLELERLGGAHRALSLYRDAVRAEGPLTPEARAGTARALRALGYPAAERRALEQLQHTDPEGPAADWARDRLEELGGR